MENNHPNNMKYTKIELNRLWNSIIYKAKSKKDLKRPNNHWLWKGRFDKSGGPVFMLKGKLQSAKIVVWKCYNGPIIQGKEIFNSCNERICVNPNHLYEAPNILSKALKDYEIRTSKFNSKKIKKVITEEDLIDIFTKIDFGYIESVSQVGEKLNVYDSIAIKLLLNDNWDLMYEYYSKEEIKELREMIIPKEYLQETNIEINQYCYKNGLCLTCLILIEKDSESNALCRLCTQSKKSNPFKTNKSKKDIVFNIDLLNSVEERYTRYINHKYAAFWI